MTLSYIGNDVTGGGAFRILVFSVMTLGQIEDMQSMVGRVRQ